MKRNIKTTEKMWCSKNIGRANGVCRVKGVAVGNLFINKKDYDKLFKLYHASREMVAHLTRGVLTQYITTKQFIDIVA